MVSKRERDYRKENERSKELNKHYCIALEKYLSKRFEEKLKAEDKTISKWFKENVKKYIENE